MKQKVYHVPTLELFLKKEKELFKINNGWYFGGKKSSPEKWELFKGSTCIRIDENGDMIHDNLDFYKEEGYEIIKPEKTWDNLKVGDILVNKDGNERMVFGI